MKPLIFLSLAAVSIVSSRSLPKGMDPLFLAVVCKTECRVDAFLRKDSSLPFSDDDIHITLSSFNGSLAETTIDVPEDVNFIEFEYTTDENTTSSVWDVNQSQTFIRAIRSLQIVGSMPCGKYGCPEQPLCNWGCRYTVLAAILSFGFCLFLCVLGGIFLRCIYNSYVGFRRGRKTLQLRDSVRLTECTSNASN